MLAPRRFFQLAQLDALWTVFILISTPGVEGASLTCPGSITEADAIEEHTHGISPWVRDIYSTDSETGSLPVLSHVKYNGLGQSLLQRKIDAFQTSGPVSEHKIPTRASALHRRSVVLSGEGTRHSERQAAFQSIRVNRSQSEIRRSQSRSESQSAWKFPKAEQRILHKTQHDLANLVSSMAFSAVVVFGHFIFFACARSRFPKLYSRGWLEGRVPYPPPEGFLAWVRVSLKLKPEEVVDCAGLDAAMLLKFHDLCIRLMVNVGLPTAFIMCPLHYFYGEVHGLDALSKIGILHIMDGSWLHWIHAALVWVVVVMVQNKMFEAQRSFIALRHKWLRNMGPPRATTCLVQNIPDRFCCDMQLEAHVNFLLMRECVESAYVVRKFTTEFRADLKALQSSKNQLRAAERQWKGDGRDPSKRPRHVTDEGEDVDSIKYYNRMIIATNVEVEAERDLIASAVASGDTSACTRSGFVTFKERHDAEMALSITSGTKTGEGMMIFSTPPEPTDVRYEVLQQDSKNQPLKTNVGTILIVMVFLLYLPIVGFITIITSLETLRHPMPIFNRVVENHPFITSLWDGIVGSVALITLTSFIPTFFMTIIRNFYGLAAESWCQHRLQHWYFYFQVLFVLFIFCIGNSMVSVFLNLVLNPTRVFKLFSSSLPQAAHFFCDFLAVHWATHASQIGRYTQFFKLIYYRWTMGEEDAYELVEPEDQDYFGMGARCARFSFFFVITLVFCTICPVIIVLAAVDLVLCRAVSGYLLVFAETRKPDTGGEFWCTQLKHVQHGIFLHITLMVATLCERSGFYGPGMLAALAYFFMIESQLRFDREFRAVRLPLDELAQPQAKSRKRAGDEDARRLIQELGVSAAEIESRLVMVAEKVGWDGLSAEGSRFGSGLAMTSAGKDVEVLIQELTDSADSITERLEKLTRFVDDGQKAAAIDEDAQRLIQELRASAADIQARLVNAISPKKAGNEDARRLIQELGVSAAEIESRLVMVADKVGWDGMSAKGSWFGSWFAMGTADKDVEVLIQELQASADNITEHLDKLTRFVDDPQKAAAIDQDAQWLIRELRVSEADVKSRLLKSISRKKAGDEDARRLLQELCASAAEIEAHFVEIAEKVCWDDMPAKGSWFGNWFAAGAADKDVEVLTQELQASADSITEHLDKLTRFIDDPQKATAIDENAQWLLQELRVSAAGIQSRLVNAISRKRAGDEDARRHIQELCLSAAEIESRLAKIAEKVGWDDMSSSWFGNWFEVADKDVEVLTQELQDSADSITEQLDELTQFVVDGQKAAAIDEDAQRLIQELCASAADIQSRLVKLADEVGWDGIFAKVSYSEYAQPELARKS